MKSSQKNTVTLAMLWIGAMAFAAQPGWIRNARDFVLGASGHNTVVSAGGSAGSAGIK